MIEPVILNNQTDFVIPTAEQFSQWVSLALDFHKKNAQVSIEIVSKEQIQKLNNEFRGFDKPTNVLSFEMNLPDYIDEPLIGDLAICAEVVEQEAHSQNKLSEHHWAHLVIHGTLHLLGYDHIIDDEAEDMEALEIQLLKQINIENPYEN